MESARCGLVLIDKERVDEIDDGREDGGRSSLSERETPESWPPDVGTCLPMFCGGEVGVC
jgi:hypothetical protein